MLLSSPFYWWDKWKSDGLYNLLKDTVTVIGLISGTLGCVFPWFRGQTINLLNSPLIGIWEILLYFSPFESCYYLRATNMKNVSQPSDIIKHFNCSPSLSPQPFTMFQLVKWSACSVESQGPLKAYYSDALCWNTESIEMFPGWTPKPINDESFPLPPTQGYEQQNFPPRAHH